MQLVLFLFDRIFIYKNSYKKYNFMKYKKTLFWQDRRNKLNKI